MPGDFSTKFEADGIKFGVVGLNSSFLHFSNEIKEVFISPKQLHVVTDSQPDDWTSDVDIAILMTHHPRSWFSTSTKNDYDSLIYIPERFYAHYCGHLHYANDINTSEGSNEVRRYRQGVSLFGLDKTEQGAERLHGYSHYTFAKDEDGAREILIPRKASKQYNGTWSLAPDHGFRLDSQDQLTRNLLVCTEPVGDVATVDKEETLGDDFDDIKDLNNTSLISYLDDAALRQFEWRLPKSQERHRRVRGGEFAQAQRFLCDSRLLWIESDWGMGKDDFLGVLFERIKGTSDFIFKLDCDGIYDIDGFYHGFEEQYGLQLQTFLADVCGTHGVFIVFDNIGNELIEDHGVEFSRILNIVKDYSEKVSIICTSRYKNDYFTHANVNLQPLQSYEIKAYVEGHSDFTRDMLAEDYLDIIHIKSSGIPMIIDNIVSALSVVSIDELSDYELDIRNAGSELESTPASLKLAIKLYSDSNDDVYKRCYNLLKVLSFLPYGESLKKIKGHD